MSTEGYDFVIVGSGSAGSVLAARLTEDPACRVCLIEAGGPGRDPLLRIPLMTGLILRGRRHNWCYETEPVPGLNGRRCALPRGKVLGGSSMINGMVYTRGLPSDYDRWAQSGLSGWSFADLFPYFVKAEDCADGAEGWHGRGGPMTVARRGEPSSPLFDVFLEAAVAAGQPRTDDFNGPDPHGVGLYHFSIRNGRRWSSRQAFLEPAMSRRNLTILTGTTVRKVEFEGSRAVGVTIGREGRKRRISAAREVVLCAGTIGSPHLLMLSGIGDAQALRDVGNPVIVDRPEVGRNLQDHVLVRVIYRCTKAVTLHNLTRPDRGAMAILRAMLFGTGPGATFPLEAGGFLKSDMALDLPDLQVHFMSGTGSGSLRWNPFTRPQPGIDGHGFMANVSVMRPLSRGSISLKSIRPEDPPAIQPNYLAERGDLETLKAGVRRLREIFAAEAFDPWRGEELSPGPGVGDGQIEEWLRGNAETMHHAVGTCRMGEDPGSVVDSSLRVRGVEALRIADASVMPSISSANTHAPTVMIAEKAADLLRGEAPPDRWDPRDGPTTATGRTATGLQ